MKKYGYNSNVKPCIKVPIYYNVKPMLSFVEFYTSVTYIIVFDIKFIYKEIRNNWEKN